MSLLKKATIKSYDAAQHRAAVQIAGSLGVWLDSVPVATDVPAAEVVAGRVCSVLFLDEGNPEDAVVLEVHGALPSGGGGGHTTFVAHSDTPGSYSGQALELVRVNAGETALEFFDLLAAANTWSALQTFTAGLQLGSSAAIKDSGGTDRYKPATSSPHNTLSGDVKLDGWTAIKGTPTANQYLAINPSSITLTAPTDLINATPTSATINANGVSIRGVAGNPSFTIGAAKTGITIRGLQYLAAAAFGDAASSVTELVGASASWGDILYAGAVLAAYGVLIDAPTYLSPGGTYTTIHGPRIRDQMLNSSGISVTNVHQLKIDDLSALASTLSTLLEVGPATPNLRVEPNAPTNPGADKGRSRVLGAFNENGTVNLRRYEWKDYSTLGAGDRVLVAV